MNMIRMTSLLALVIASMFAPKTTSGNELQGTWVLVSEFRNGQRIERLSPMRCIITEHELQFEWQTEDRSVQRDTTYSVKGDSRPSLLALGNGRFLFCDRSNDTLVMYTPSTAEQKPGDFNSEKVGGWIRREFRSHKPRQKQTMSQVSVLRNASESKNAEVVSVSDSILKAWTARNREQANEMALEYRIRRKIAGRDQQLGASELEEVLATDPTRQEWLMQSVDAAMDRRKASAHSLLDESIWQQIELLKSLDIDDEIQERIADIAAKLPARTQRTSSRRKLVASELFAKGLPIYLESDMTEPLEIDASSGIAAVKLPIRYVRHPSLPPGGLRIAAKLIIDRSGRKMLVSHQTGFRPCAFTSGKVEGEFYMIGKAPIPKNSTLFVYATTLYGEKSNPIPISNVVKIPVVVPERQSELRIDAETNTRVSAESASSSGYPSGDVGTADENGAGPQVEVAD